MTRFCTTKRATISVGGIRRDQSAKERWEGIRERAAAHTERHKTEGTGNAVCLSGREVCKSIPSRSRQVQRAKERFPRTCVATRIMSCTRRTHTHTHDHGFDAQQVGPREHTTPPSSAKTRRHHPTPHTDARHSLAAGLTRPTILGAPGLETAPARRSSASAVRSFHVSLVKRHAPRLCKRECEKVGRATRSLVASNMELVRVGVVLEGKLDCQRELCSKKHKHTHK